jgi:hypothetical protein
MMELNEKQKTLVRSVHDDPAGREALEKAFVIAVDQASVELKVTEVMSIFRSLGDILHEETQEELSDETE